MVTSTWALFRKNISLPQPQIYKIYRNKYKIYIYKYNDKINKIQIQKQNKQHFKFHLSIIPEEEEKLMKKVILSAEASLLRKTDVKAFPPWHLKWEKSNKIFTFISEKGGGVLLLKKIFNFIYYSREMNNRTHIWKTLMNQILNISITLFKVKRILSDKKLRYN